MRKSFCVTSLIVLMISVFISCQSTDKKEDAAKSSLQSDTSTAKVNSEQTQYEYRAVCIEKEAHGGNRQMLTRWLDSREKAEDYGREHGDFKYKGHRWIIEERVKK